MANSSAPFGLKAVRHMTGGEIQSNAYTIASGYNTNIFTGDPVLQTTDGSIIIAVGTAGSASQNIVGVFAGCKYTAADGSQKYSKYWPASTVATNIEAYVIDDPNVIFLIQTDATGATDADRGQLVDVRIGSGNTLTGKSTTYLDTTTGGATTGKALRILRLVNDSVNASGAYTTVEVLFEAQAIKGVVSAVGGI